MSMCGVLFLRDDAEYNTSAMAPPGVAVFSAYNVLCYPMTLLLVDGTLSADSFSLVIVAVVSRCAKTIPSSFFRSRFSSLAVNNLRLTIQMERRRFALRTAP